MLYNKRLTKALIRLRGCAGWSVPLLFANPRRQGFSRRGPINVNQPAIVRLVMRFAIAIDGYDVFQFLAVVSMLGPML